MLIAQARKALQHHRRNGIASDDPGFETFNIAMVFGGAKHMARMVLVDLEAVKEEVAELRRLIRTYLYTDLYNMDDTGFFFNSVPRGSLCVNTTPAMKQDKVSTVYQR